MLVELAVGDAYGAGFEYAEPGFVAAHNDVAGYRQHPGHTDLAPGQYTDDTQMTLAVAELLVDGALWTPEVLADKFVEVFHRDPRAGYASRFHALLSEVHTGAELLDRLRPESDKSGAAMRATPIGLLPTVGDVLHHAAVQARVTHDTPAGVASAQAAALAAYYCRHDLGPLTGVGAWVSSVLDDDWATPWEGPVGSKGSMSVRAALTAMGAGGLTDILGACVAFTGDVDTVATVALGAASLAVPSDLPASLVDDLENGRYGRDHLTALDTRLVTPRLAG
ncbi:ADP-ribosylglycohydrolase family protein [Actinokineospora cianjurensis]|uniref:ADP-ribosylglycohydrolase n=1 Tax=Actinokineospora cianjurensis TaxID=585224 RepID=A0A421B506_9PSEU|nr:ADP-ribosylglycohydrolase family protein [Actinokineospora cianjurensis]RLK59370.1 ADP-ribosylglycohydrolase [Actinokineospora cianjurensis]